jgi:hypothetical protein
MFPDGNKPPLLPKTLLTASGQLSDKSTAFNETMWGDITRVRIFQAKTVLRDSSFTKIIQKAQEFEKIGANGSKTSTSAETKVVDDSAQILDLSDPEWD